MTCAPSHLLPERHAGGRPRTVSLTPDEMIKLGEEMVDWCAENKPLHLSQFWSIYKDISDDDWETLKKRPEFVRYYTKSMRIVGMSYLDKDSKVDVRVKDRWQRVYFKDLRNQEDEDAKTASNLKKEEARVINDVESSKLDTFIDMVSSLQASSKALKSEEIKSNAEAKS
jgi:epoxyqueuosine reductase QueG